MTTYKFLPSKAETPFKRPLTRYKLQAISTKLLFEQLKVALFLSSTKLFCKSQRDATAFTATAKAFPFRMSCSLEVELLQGSQPEDIDPLSG
jgi:hypothetical protein